MSGATNELAAVACQQAIARMTHCFDAGDFDAGLALYHEDAVWHRPDGVLRGRDAIAGYYHGRPKNAVICHVVTNLSVVFDGPGKAVCTYYSMGFRTVTEGAPVLPVAMGGPGVIWRYHDTLLSTRDGWRVTERRADRILEVGA
ncbi:MAG: nuclear transport factor 2 family protein [Rhizobiaceae bacterium]|nr:nuclear transport factor 2 family protein [Rhizobiaceae bacterium]